MGKSVYFCSAFGSLGGTKVSVRRAKMGTQCDSATIPVAVSPVDPGDEEKPLPERAGRQVATSGRDKVRRPANAEMICVPRDYGTK